MQTEIKVSVGNTLVYNWAAWCPYEDCVVCHPLRQGISSQGTQCVPIKNYFTSTMIFNSVLDEVSSSIICQQSY